MHFSRTGETGIESGTREVGVSDTSGCVAFVAFELFRWRTVEMFGDLESVG